VDAGQPSRPPARAARPARQPARQVAAGPGPDVMALHVARHAPASAGVGGRSRGRCGAGPPRVGRAQPPAGRRQGRRPVVPPPLHRAGARQCDDAGGADGDRRRRPRRDRSHGDGVLRQGPGRAGADGAQRRVRRPHARAVGRAGAGRRRDADLVLARHADRSHRGRADPLQRRPARRHAGLRDRVVGAQRRPAGGAALRPDADDQGGPAAHVDLRPGARRPRGRRAAGQRRGDRNPAGGRTV
ncbi:MAG: hypothetical protein AVDCRST_MAG38-2187, partial [uncultured Solirubrobacteraceae bacterium]